MLTYLTLEAPIAGGEVAGMAGPQRQRFTQTVFPQFERFLYKLLRAKPQTVSLACLQGMSWVEHSKIQVSSIAA